MNLAHHVLEALINCYSNRRSESLSANQLTRFESFRTTAVSCSSSVGLRCDWSRGRPPRSSVRELGVLGRALRLGHRGDVFLTLLLPGEPRRSVRTHALA